MAPAPALSPRRLFQSSPGGSAMAAVAAANLPGGHDGVWISSRPPPLSPARRRLVGMARRTGPGHVCQIAPRLYAARFGVARLVRKPCRTG
nr:unnamed protein product [Digitaria exilis]